MRITYNDVKTLTESYSKVNENLGLGPNTIKPMTVTSVGSTGPKIPRSPIAALKGEVPGTAGVEEAEESPIPMALSNLNNIIHRAEMLKELMESEDELPPWAAAKITLATDYIESVVDYIKFRDEGGFEHEHTNELEDEGGVIVTDLGPI